MQQFMQLPQMAFMLWGIFIADNNTSIYASAKSLIRARTYEALKTGRGGYLHDIIIIFYIIIIVRELQAIKVQVLESSLPDLSRPFLKKLASSCLSSFLTPVTAERCTTIRVILGNTSLQKLHFR